MRYLVQQKFFSFPVHFWITDEAGTEMFALDGQSFQLRKTFELRDRAGTVVAFIRQQPFPHRGSLDIERDGALLATVRRAGFRPRYEATLADGTVLTAKGRFADQNWEITAPDRVVGRISRPRFQVRDVYTV